MLARPVAAGAVHITVADAVSHSQAGGVSAATWSIVVATSCMTHGDASYCMKMIAEVIATGWRYQLLHEQLLQEEDR